MKALVLILSRWMCCQLGTPSWLIPVHFVEVQVHSSASVTPSNPEPPPAAAAAEARQHLAKAKAICESLVTSSDVSLIRSSTIRTPSQGVAKSRSEFSPPSSQSLENDNCGYRMYIDIGRESGTWWTHDGGQAVDASSSLSMYPLQDW